MTSPTRRSTTPCRSTNPSWAPRARAAIFAYGRNPFRNGFDSATANLWIADVGQGVREEVNFIDDSSPGGQNFGWRVREGDIANPGVDGPLQPGMVDPVLAYDRSIGTTLTEAFMVHNAALDLNGDRYDPGMCNRYVSPEAGDMERYWHVGARQPWGAAEVFPRAPGPFLRANREKPLPRWSGSPPAVVFDAGPVTP